MAVYTERLLAPWRAIVQAQAEEVGVLKERLAAAEAEIAGLKAPPVETPAEAPETERGPSPEWVARRWWQRLLWG